MIALRVATPCIAHKQKMEAVFAGATGARMVLKLSLAIGPGHRAPTLVQFFYERIMRGEAFEVWTLEFRYAIDSSNVFRIAGYCIGGSSFWGRRINVALRPLPVPQFVHEMEPNIEKSVVRRLLDKAQHYEISCPVVAGAAAQLNLDISELFLRQVLQKYFES